jgi:hypothetical protein
MKKTPSTVAGTPDSTSVATYGTPRLTRHGRVQDLTEALGQAGVDALSGSTI